MDIKKSNFKAYDLFLVAFLQLQKHQILATSPNSEGRSEFEFEPTDALLNDVEKFKNDRTVEIPIRSYGKVYKDLRFLIHNPRLIKGSA